MSRRRKPRVEETENHERWLVSYADFITLLFAFFVVMYAISSVNEGKYRVLSDTLVDAFSTPPKANKPIQIGKTQTQLSPPDKKTEVVDKPQPVIQPPKPSINENRMQEIAERVKDVMQPLIDQDLIKIDFNKLWVEVEMNTSILFASGSSELEPEANAPLRELASVLRTLPNYIDVEGHTDNLPISTKVFPSNWELSAARAASVVHLFSQNGVAPERMAAIGFGEFRPKVSNDTLPGRRANRRVVVVILADKHARRMME
jgi:chemotaxis protein MotB